MKFITTLFLLVLSTGAFAQNNPLDTKNNRLNSENSPLATHNSRLNSDNMNGGKNATYDSSGRQTGYAVTNKEGTTNIFNIEGERTGFIPAPVTEPVKK